MRDQAVRQYSTGYNLIKQDCRSTHEGYLRLQPDACHLADEAKSWIRMIGTEDVLRLYVWPFEAFRPSDSDRPTGTAYTDPQCATRLREQNAGSRSIIPPRKQECASVFAKLLTEKRHGRCRECDCAIPDITRSNNACVKIPVMGTKRVYLGRRADDADDVNLLFSSIFLAAQWS